MSKIKEFIRILFLLVQMGKGFERPFSNIKTSVITRC